MKDIEIEKLAKQHELVFPSDSKLITPWMEGTDIRKYLLSFARALLKKERSNAKKRQTKLVTYSSSDVQASSSEQPPWLPV